MGQQASLSDKVHLAICNSEKDTLANLMAQPEFTPEMVDVRMMVELIQKQWDNEVIYKFADLASDDQLASLVATAILHNHVISLDKLFSKMQEPSATIERHHLRELFYTVCDRANLEAVKSLVQHQCYDPQDDRPLVTVFRTAMRKNFAVDEELLDLVMQALPGQTEAARYLLERLPEESKREETKELLKSKLERYLNGE
eukprot:gene9169-6448_t